MEQRQFESCGHSGCGYLARQEYCEIEAAEPNGAASVVVELMDEIIGANHQVSSESYHSRSDTSSNSVVIERSFSYLQGDFKGYVWPLEEVSLDMRYELDVASGSETYFVAPSWRNLRGAVGSDSRVAAAYAIQINPSGPAMAFVSELSPETGVSAERRMTEYDFRWLFDELGVLYERQLAEQREARTIDNRRLFGGEV